MNEIKEYLPFIIPLVILELAVLGYTIHHILTHNNYKHGSRAVWIIVSVLLMNTFIGPILYFVFGKEED